MKLACEGYCGGDPPQPEKYLNCKILPSIVKFTKLVASDRISVPSSCVRAPYKQQEEWSSNARDYLELERRIRNG